MTETVRVIDSHTEGEPTRVVLAGGPDLGSGPMAGRLEIFRARYDHFRSAVVNEPRGSDILVGALLCEPDGVIFFNNVGYLGMCGHGTIGVVATLAHLGRIVPGSHRIETPVGPVNAILRESGDVTVENVPSYRTAANVAVEVDGYGLMHGDIAWGGNWFFLVEDHGQRLALDNVEILTDCTWKIRQALTRMGHPEIDHIELFGPPSRPDAHSRNFVLCPGKAYDRSPCGTGTSAKLACLAAAGKLREGELYRQESIVGTVFEGSYRRAEGDAIFPSIRGRAWITGEATLLFDTDDPFRAGIRV